VHALGKLDIEIRPLVVGIAPSIVSPALLVVLLAVVLAQFVGGREIAYLEKAKLVASKS
jgi:hypothetical protein